MHSVDFYLSQGGYVVVSVCLSVCLSVNIVTQHEAQLMLTNPRDAFVGQPIKATKHGTIRHVRYGFLSVL